MLNSNKKVPRSTCKTKKVKSCCVNYKRRRCPVGELCTRRNGSPRRRLGGTKKINPRPLRLGNWRAVWPGPRLLAMDHTIQAASGVMSATGDADALPSRSGGAPATSWAAFTHMQAYWQHCRPRSKRPRHWWKSPCRSRCFTFAQSWQHTKRRVPPHAPGHRPMFALRTLPRKDGGSLLSVLPKPTGTACWVVVVRIKPTTATFVIPGLAKTRTSSRRQD